MPMPRPTPMIGPMSGEINIAPMITAVLLTFSPMDAMKMARMRIHTLNPLKSTSRMMPSMVSLGCAFPVMLRVDLSAPIKVLYGLGEAASVLCLLVVEVILLHPFFAKVYADIVDKSLDHLLIFPPAYEQSLGRVHNNEVLQSLYGNGLFLGYTDHIA